jgi:hypothetical protein
MNVREKTTAVKDHLLDNRHVYVALAAGVGAGMLLSNKGEAMKLVVKIKGDHNIVIAELARRGHPGLIVRDLETGEVFASLSRAAEAAGMNRSSLRKLIGTRFEILGDAR